MNEDQLRQKMLEELMGQMDERQMGRIKPQPKPPAPPMMSGERGNLSDADVEAMGDPNEDDELTRRLRQAATVGSVRG